MEVKESQKGNPLDYQVPENYMFKDNNTDDKDNIIAKLKAKIEKLEKQLKSQKIINEKEETNKLSKSIKRIKSDITNCKASILKHVEAKIKMENIIN